MLGAIPYSEDDYDNIREFECGDEPWAREAEKWIKGQIRGDDCIAIKKANGSVWLFLEEDDEVIGFASLITTSWPYPEAHNRTREFPYIPRLAIASAHQHQPPDVRPEERYSGQIMAFLIEEARQMCREPRDRPLAPVLALMVDRENEKAIRVYQRAGFTHFPVGRSDYDMNRKLCKMIAHLNDPPPDELSGLDRDSVTEIEVGTPIAQ